MRRRRIDPQILAIDRDRDTLSEDYVRISLEVDESPTDFPWMTMAREGSGTAVDYDFGYGSGFVVTTQEATEIADGLIREGWWDTGWEATLVAHGIAQFYRSAADEGRCVIGGVA